MIKIRKKYKYHYQKNIQINLIKERKFLLCLERKNINVSLRLFIIQDEMRTAVFNFIY